MAGDTDASPRKGPPEAEIVNGRNTPLLLIFVANAGWISVSDAEECEASSGFY